MPIFASLALQEICRTRGLKHVSSSFFVYISLRACWLLKNLFRWCSNALHEKALRFVGSSLARLPCDLLLSLWATYKKYILIRRPSSTLGPLSATSIPIQTSKRRDQFQNGWPAVVAPQGAFGSFLGTRISLDLADSVGLDPKLES